jgi:anti-sigma regulatory factor (Ser/Thr protein kinase)
MSFVRRFVTSEDDLFHAELIIGEVLANTVKHAPGIVTLVLDWTGVNPVLTVVDDGPGSFQFSPTLPDDDLTEDGRGLFLIGSLAKDVQVESTPGRGTKMTVHLSVDRGSAATSDRA